MTVVKQWQKLLREAVESLPLEIFRTQVDLVLSTPSADPAVGKGLNPTISQRYLPASITL